VCLTYRVRKMLLCTVMCAWGIRWEKYYCLQWCVSVVECKGNVTVYSDVFLRYRMREMLLCTVMCFWGTGWGKCYCVQWCVSELQVKEMLLCTLMFVWGTGWGKCYCPNVGSDIWQICFMVYRDALEKGINFRCYTQYILVSSITACSVISGFSNWLSTVNAVIYGNNTLRCVLGW